MSNIRPTPPKSRATLSQIILFVFVLLQSLQMPTRINAKGLNIGWTCVRIRCAKSIVIVIFFYDPVIIFSAFINWFITTDAFTHIHPPWFIYFFLLLCCRPFRYISQDTDDVEPLLSMAAHLPHLPVFYGLQLMLIEGQPRIPAPHFFIRVFKSFILLFSLDSGITITWTEAHFVYSELTIPTISVDSPLISEGKSCTGSNIRIYCKHNETRCYP